MKYPVKKRKQKLGGEYFRQRELENLRVKYKGKRMSLQEASRLEFRQMSGVEERVYRKKGLVEYQGEIGQVKKVTHKGIWIEKFHKADKKGIAYPSGKVVFVSEKKAEKEVQPFFTNIPIPITIYPPVYFK